MTRRIGLAAGLTAAVVALGAAPASAGTLDQSQTSSNAYASFGGPRLEAQTFTAGLTGNLDQVDVNFRHSPSSCTIAPDAVVEIRTVTGGAPSDTTLATTSIPAGSITTSFAWISAAFPAPASVTAGTQYALVFSSPGSCSGGFLPYDWGASTSNPYAGGNALLKDNGGSWFNQGGSVDVMFRTYVGPPSPVVPPPPMGCRPPRTRSPSASRR